MNKDEPSLTRRETALLLGVTVGTGLLSGFMLWALAKPPSLYAVAIVAVLFFLGPGTCFRALCGLGQRGVERRAFARGDAMLQFNLAALFVAVTEFFLLCLWRAPLK